MQRRSFLQKLGIGVPALAIGKQGFTKVPYTWQTYRAFYPEINTLDNAKTREGQIILRLALESTNPVQLAGIEGQLEIKGAKINRTKSYFFEPGEDHLEAQNFTAYTSLDHTDVLVAWLDGPTENTEVTIKKGGNPISFSLKDIVAQKQLTFNSGTAKITVNFLLDKEIGEIDPTALNITPPADDFTFALMADPQGGDPTDATNNSTTRMKIHNAFVEESVELVNSLAGNPLFTLMVGDIVDHQGQWTNYQAMLSLFKPLKTPVLFSVGNHETRYQAVFGPGYNMEEFTNFFNAQKQVNGLDKILYSFNLGQWHFVVWPDPLRANFWETHPHYFDWLESDLEKHKDRPTMFFHHVPLMPIGINPLINYVETVDVKRQVIEILARHGNVKFAISGHVHIPLKASAKIAVSYKGINFINLPAAGYRPRAFGEEDFYGGPTQGIAIVEVKGKEATINYENVTREVYSYDNKLPAFDSEKWPLWLNHKWELPATDFLRNGNFKDGLQHWAQRFVYKEDVNPSNLCEVQKNARQGSAQSLYLFTRKRGYDAPGQDRLPQTINRLCQAVNVNSNEIPSLSLSFKIDPAHYRASSYNGAYVWIEGFEKFYKRANLVYSVNKMYYSIGGNHSDVKLVKPVHFDIAAQPGDWHALTINFQDDFNQHAEGKKLTSFAIDRIVINLGVWTVNDGNNQEIGMHFDALSLHHRKESSNLDGKPLDRKSEDDFWYGGIKHVAGEHQYKIN